jgi:hypothetical protein
MMADKLNRRDFFKGAIILVSGSVVAAVAYLFDRNIRQTTGMQPTRTSRSTAVADQPAEPTTTNAPPSEQRLTETEMSMPESEPTRQPEPTPTPNGLPGTIGARFPGRVVHVTHEDVHAWNYKKLNYWDFVNQNAVDEMVNQGLIDLTGQSTVAEAWRSLIPDYQPGEVVAIKVSFNNSHDDLGSQEKIDGVMEPVNALIRGLNSIGVPYDSIVVYDSSRWLPKRFVDKCPYQGVLFRHKAHDPWGDGSAAVEFSPPGVSVFTQRLSKEVAQANYLINVPIMKPHGMTKLSLALKNHYGSVEKPAELHRWSTLASPDFSTNYNPMVDLNNTPHIRDKTVLTLGDGIFAALRNGDGSFPVGWAVFGNQTPKSLFFSTDPVAIDCVMGDVVDAEKNALVNHGIELEAFACLEMAEEIGLGVFDRGNPWQNTYTKIEYIKREL